MKSERSIMKEQGGGVIVNTASEAGLVGMAGFSSYTASKHGVVGLTKSVALEYAKQGIRVNAIAPGPTKTNIHSGMLGGSRALSSVSIRTRIRTAIRLIRAMILPRWADFDASVMRNIPMNRFADPEEMAGVVTFLCSSDASYITGHTMPVDGGRSID